MASLQTAPRSQSVAIARRRVVELLEGSPSALPCAICIGLFVWFAGDEGGFRGTTWMPATLAILALLVVSLVALPRPSPSRLALWGLGLLAAYAAWSYLSITWADQKGVAWDGANRTVFYALVLALFALWPMRGQAAAVLLGLFGLGVAVVGLVELIKANNAAHAVQYFRDNRLSEPAGYTNANVALWFTAFWPCVVLAGRRQVPAALRALFLAGATLLAGLALLGQSRGWLLVLPLMIVLTVVLVPGRGRTIVAFGVVGIAIGLITKQLLDVYNHLSARKPPGAVFHTTVRDLLLVSALVGLASFAVAMVDRRVSVTPSRARRLSAAAVVALALAAVGAIGTFAAVKESPFTAVSHAWHDFKKGGVEPYNQTGRLGASLATYRYDYWVVAWKAFERHPLTGVGADNFQQIYLLRGKSYQTPSNPHSLGLRALSETGLVGALLLGGGLIAAFIAGLPAIRRADLAGGAAGAGLLVFSYWIVHGSVDWLWEFPGLGGPALAGLGIAIAIGTWRRGTPLDRGPLLGRGRGAWAASAAVLVVMAGLVPPWLAERELRGARAEAGRDPAGALRRLDRSASLNPLSPLPKISAAVIDVRQGDLPAARRELVGALDRDPRDSVSWMLLAAIESQEFKPAQALSYALRSRQLAPRDQAIRQLTGRLERGKLIAPQDVETAFRSDIRRRNAPH